MMTNNNHNKFDKRLYAVSSYFKELRYSENLTQAEVGIKTGLHRNTILNIENSKNFEIATFFRLCDFYEISATEILSIID